MITERCSIVLTTPRIDIPENPNVFELINDVIHNNLCNIEYFGALIDNQADYIDEAMADKMASTSFFTIHFDIEKPIDLDSYSTDDEMINLFLNVMMEYEINQIDVDDKDVTIYVNV